MTSAETRAPGAELERRMNRLLAALREDVAAQQRIVEFLTRQERAVAAPSEDSFGAATTSLERELARSPFRAEKRNRSLRSMAEGLGVPASAMTLTSAAERMGDAGAPLLVERDRLRAVAGEVRRRNLRVAALVRMHRDVTRDLLQIVLGKDGANVHEGGTLIDAEV